MFQKKIALINLCAFVGLLLFYLLSSPANLAESNDAYWYASIVDNVPIESIGDVRLYLYFLLGKLFYGIVNYVWQDVDSLHSLSILSAIAASASVILFYYYLSAVVKCTKIPALFGAAMLAVTYGFWRYASVAEVYIPAIAIILALLLLFASADSKQGVNVSMVTWKQARIHSCFGVISGIACGFYQPIAIILLIAYPLSQLRAKAFSVLIIYVASAGFSISTLYFVAFLLHGGNYLALPEFVSFLLNRSGEFAKNDFSVLVSVGAIISFLRMIVATNWIFGFETVVDWVSRVFPNKPLSQEIFQATYVSYEHVLALLLFVTLVICFTIAFLSKNIISNIRMPGQNVAMLWWWLGLYFLVCFVLSPFSYEAYILLLPPVVGLITALLVEPGVSSGRRVPLFLGLIAFGALNWVGGLAVANGPERDLVGRKAEWIVQNASSSDTVVVGPGQWMTGSLIRYRVGATVLVADQPQTLPTVMSKLASGGRVFALESAINVDANDAIDEGEGLTLRETSAHLRAAAQQIHENDAGRTFVIRP